MPKTWICGSRTKHGKRSELQVDLRAAGRKRLHQRSNGDFHGRPVDHCRGGQRLWALQNEKFGFFPNSGTFALCCNLSNYIYIHAISYIIQFYIYIYILYTCSITRTHAHTHIYIYIYMLVRHCSEFAHCSFFVAAAAIAAVGVVCVLGGIAAAVIKRRGL